MGQKILKRCSRCQYYRSGKQRFFKGSMIVLTILGLPYAGGFFLFPYHVVWAILGLILVGIGAYTLGSMIIIFGEFDREMCLSRDAYSVVHSNYPEHINKNENCRFFVGHPVVDDTVSGEDDGSELAKQVNGKQREGNKQNERKFEQAEQEPDTDHATQIVKDERYYGKVMGLKGRITKVDVNRCYKELCQQYHPDRVNHLGPKLKELAEKEMKEINEAYAYFEKKYGM